MRNAKEFEAMLTDPKSYAKLVKNGKKQRKAIESTIRNDLLTEKMRIANGVPDRIFDVVHEHFPLKKIQELLAIESDAFERVDCYESLFTSSTSQDQASFAVMRSPHALSLVTAVDPHMLAVSKKRKQGTARTITFPTGQAEFIILKGEMKVRVWRMNGFDDSTDLKEFDTGLVAEEPIVLKTGDRLRQVDFESLEFLPHEQPCLFLYTLMNKGAAPLDLSLDIETGAIKNVSSASGLSTRLQMHATLLRMLKRKDAYKTIEELLDNEHHFVRWHTMRELLGLDMERTLPRLKKMEQEDPQPSVRRAAKKTLEMLAVSVDA